MNDLTTFHPLTNNAIATAASGSLNNTTDPVTFSVGTGEGALFPAPATDGPFWVTVWNPTSYPNPGNDPNMEVMLCTARSSDSLTCTRAAQGTAAVAHTGSPAVGLLLQDEHLSELQTEVNDTRLWMGRGGVRIFEDFIGSANSTASAGVFPSGWVSRYTGALAGSTTHLTGAHPGIVTLDTTSGTTNYAALALGPDVAATLPVLLGGGAWRLETCIRLDDLAAGGEDYDVFFGWNDGNYNVLGSNACLLEYNVGNSANWHGVTKDAGTTTRTTTGTAVVEDAWLRLTVDVNAAATSAVFRINGTSVLTITTNIPTTNPVWPWLAIVKSAGSTSRKLHCDYLDVQHQLTTAR